MGNPSRILTVNRIPYRIWFEISHQEVETKISFPLFRLFRGNGSWCRISRVQSPSHHIGDVLIKNGGALPEQVRLPVTLSAKTASPPLLSVMDIFLPTVL